MNANDWLSLLLEWLFFLSAVAVGTAVVFLQMARPPRRVVTSVRHIKSNLHSVYLTYQRTRCIVSHICCGPFDGSNDPVKAEPL